MRINEVIVVDPQLDEISAFGAGSGIGKVAGNVVGGVKDFWAGAKQGYQNARAGFVTGQGLGTTGTNATTAPQPTGGQAAAQQTAPPAGAAAPAAQAGGQAAAPAAQAAPQAAAQPDELEQLKTTIAKLTPQQKQEVSAALQAPAAQQQPKNDVDAVSDQEIAQSTAGRTDAQLAADAAKTNLDPRVKAAVDAEIQKRKSQKPAAAQQPAAQQPAAPAGTSVDIGQVKQQSAQQAQAAQAGKQTAQQQIAATQAANAEKAKQDAAVKAAKDAAMAKPAFQQTASDKLAIQKAQQMGIREAVSESKQPKKPAPKQPAKKPSPGKKKKVTVEFDSKFLGRKI